MTPAWAERLQFALLRFGLSPAQVWALSLAEWRALTAQAPTGLSRTELDTLIRLYPDEIHDHPQL